MYGSGDTDVPQHLAMKKKPEVFLTMATAGLSKFKDLCMKTKDHMVSKFRRP